MRSGKRRINTKAKGNERERKTRDWLENFGWRTHSNKASRMADEIWATKHIGGKIVVLFAQVKSNGWPSSSEKRILESLVGQNCHIAECYRWDDYARVPKKQTWVASSFLKGGGVWKETNPEIF